MANPSNEDRVGAGWVLNSPRFSDVDVPLEQGEREWHAMWTERTGAFIWFMEIEGTMREEEIWLSRGVAKGFDE